MSRPDPVAAVLLAAGRSSRMGEHKLLLDLAGEPLARHALRALASTPGLDPIVVVLGREADRVRAALAGLGATFVVNEQYESGIASSFRAGALAVAGDAALFALADQPLVPSEHYAALAATGTTLAATRSEGDVMPPHVARGPALEAVRAHGLGIKRLLECHTYETQFLELAPAGLVDVDAPADLERVRALLAAR